MTGEIFDLESWRQTLLQSMTDLVSVLLGFLPSLFAMLAILLFGWLVSRLVEFLASRGFARLGLDAAADRVGLTESLRRANLQGPFSRLIAKLLFWVLMLTFALSAVETLGLTAVTATVDRLIAFLPSVIGAALIVVLGMLFARFVRNLISSAAAAAHLPAAHRLGGAAGSVTALVVLVLALEHLGVETALLIQTITVTVAAFGVTVGVAFALGARPIVTHILAGHYLRKSLPAQSMVEVCGRRGVVERVGATETLFRGEHGSFSVPNAQLLDEVIGR